MRPFAIQVRHFITTNTLVVRALILVGLLVLVTSVQASYGQMRLDGVTLWLVFTLIVVYGVMVDIALLNGMFKRRWAVNIAAALAVALLVIFLSSIASPNERAGFFKGTPGGSELVMLVVTSAVFLPFIILAPFAQYRSIYNGQRWPRWIGAWMIVQLALVPGFLILASTEKYFLKQEQAAGEAVGREAKAGELTAILERAKQRHERIWGTGLHYPWTQEPPPGLLPRRSGWMLGLAQSLDASELMTSNQPLSESDRVALNTLMSRYIGRYIMAHTRAKIIWDALEPGKFYLQVAPNGVDERGIVSEETLPALLEQLEKYAATRLCPGGQLMDADREVLNALVLKRGRIWDVDKQEYVMRPGWADFPRRVNQLCSGEGL